MARCHGSHGIGIPRCAGGRDVRRLPTGVVHPMPSSRAPRFTWTVVVAALVLAVCGAPAIRAESTPSASTAASTPPAVTARYRDGVLLLRAGGESKRDVLVATWPVDEIAEDSHGYREARLELLDDDERKKTTRPPARDLPIHDVAEWNDVVRQVMTGLAPTGENDAALTLVQGEEIVFFLAPGGELRVYRHQYKPAERHVTSVVSEAEFSSRADALLRGRYPGQDQLLFQAGNEDDDLSFVLFDFTHRESVLIAAPSSEQGGGLGNLVRTLVRVPDTLILRGQGLGLLMRPVSSAARLAWFATQTAATLAPPVHVAGGTPAPVKPRPGMDLDAWERELDDMDLPRRYLGTIVPLIDGEAFFTSLVQALQDARKSVSIRLFIFDNDDYAVGFADLLKRRSADVRIRVLIDSLGTLGAGQGAPEGAASRPPFSIAHYLRADSDVKVRETPNTWLMADHTKTLIFDDRLAFLGGMNIGHEYRHEWHDMMVALGGPIVERLQRDFDLAWAYAGLGGDLAYLHALGDGNRSMVAPPGLELRGHQASVHTDVQYAGAARATRCHAQGAARDLGRAAVRVGRRTGKRADGCAGARRGRTDCPAVERRLAIHEQREPAGSTCVDEERRKGLHLPGHDARQGGAL